MDGQDRDRVGVGIELGRRRIVARLDERRQVRRHEHRAIVGEQRRLRADDLEEAGDVLERLLGGRRVRPDEPGEQPAAAQEAVQQLPGRAFVGGGRVGAQVGHEPMHDRPGVGRDAQDARLPVELLEDRPHRAVAAARHVDDRGQVLAAEPVDVRRRERVQVDARLEVGDDAQEREQEPDLRPGIQPGRPREAPRDPGDVQRPQDRIRVAVGADEDGVVARRGAGLHPPADLGRDPVGLLGARREHLEPDRRR